MLVLIAHGSRDATWRGSLEALTAAVQAQSPDEEVGLAFMQFSGPTLNDIVEEGIGRGVATFRLLPLFMASAGHVDKDIKPLVADLVRRFPDVSLDLMRPIGEHPLLPTLILKTDTDALS